MRRGSQVHDDVQMETAEGVVKLNSDVWSDVGVGDGTIRLNSDVLSSVPEDFDPYVS